MSIWAKKKLKKITPHPLLAHSEKGGRSILLSLLLKYAIITCYFTSSVTFLIKSYFHLCCKRYSFNLIPSRMVESGRRMSIMTKLHHKKMNMHCYHGAEESWSVSSNFESQSKLLLKTFWPIRKARFGQVAGTVPCHLHACYLPVLIFLKSIQIGYWK